MTRTDMVAYCGLALARLSRRITGRSPRIGAPVAGRFGSLAWGYSGQMLRQSRDAPRGWAG
jgi:hypothetical protein